MCECPWMPLCISLPEQRRPGICLLWRRPARAEDVPCMHSFHAFAICSWGMRLRSSGQVCTCWNSNCTETWHLMRTFTVYRVKRISYWLQGCRHAQITWKKQNLSIRSKNLWLQGLCGWVGYIACSGTASVGFACRSWQVDTDSGSSCKQNKLHRHCIANIALLSYKFDAQATAVLGIALIAFGEEIGKLPRPAADASRDPQQQSINIMYNLVYII